MKKLNVFFALLMLSAFSMTVNSQTNYRKQLYDAFITEKMDNWGGIIADFEAKKILHTDAEKLELANYYYGFIGYLLGAEKLTEASMYLEKGEKLVDLLIDESTKNAAAYAYKGSFLAFRINADNSIASLLGPRSIYYITKAYNIGPDNLQAVIDKANFYFYAPGFLGGSAEKAIPIYNKAISMMESNGLAKENWQYFNTLILLGKANTKAKHYVDAKTVYNKMLAIEPNFKWVKDRLLPELMKKMK